MSKGSFVANVKRREWDLSEYEAIATEKKRAEEEADSLKDAKNRNRARQQQQLVVRAPLQHRAKEMNLDSRVGKHTVVTNTSALNQQGGFYCDVCSCLLKDSSTYLDHINGKKHQRALGMTLRAERSTLGDVRAKLEEHKRNAADTAESHASELERRLQRFSAEVARENEDKKADKAHAKAQRKAAEARMREAEEQFDLGRITSDSRKRKQKSTDGTEVEDGEEDDRPNDSDEPQQKKAKTDTAAAAGSSAATSTAAAGAVAAGAEDEEEDPEQAMMRAMGFTTGFAKGKNQ